MDRILLRLFICTSLLLQVTQRSWFCWKLLKLRKWQIFCFVDSNGVLQRGNYGETIFFKCPEKQVFQTPAEGGIVNCLMIEKAPCLHFIWPGDSPYANLQAGRAIYSGVHNYIEVCYIMWSVAFYLRWRVWTQYVHTRVLEVMGYSVGAIEVAWMQLYIICGEVDGQVDVFPSWEWRFCIWKCLQIVSDDDARISNVSLFLRARAAAVTFVQCLVRPVFICF